MSHTEGSTAQPAAPAASSNVAHINAREWGLTSLLLGATVLLMAPPMTVVMILAALGNIRWTANETRLIALLSVLPMLCLLGLAAFGLVAAFKSLAAGRGHGRGAGYAYAGLLTCLGALLFTILNFLGGFFIADDMIRLRMPAHSQARQSSGEMRPPVVVVQ